MLIVRIFLCAIIFAASWSASAQTRSWSSLSAEQSRIYLSMDVDKTYSKTGWDDAYSQRHHRVLVLNIANSDPRAEIYFFELAPGRFFPVLNGPRKMAKKLNYFKSGYKLLVDEQVHKNDKMEMLYMVVDRQPRQCVLFVAKSGDGAGDGQISAGNAALYGYYCNPDGQDMVPALNSPDLKCRWPQRCRSPCARIGLNAPACQS